jgi:hypothetical protein
MGLTITVDIGGLEVPSHQSIGSASILAARTFFTKPRGYPAAQLCCRWWVSAAAGAGERRHEDRLVEHCGQCAAVHRGKVGTPVGAKQVSTVQAGQETAGEGVDASASFMAMATRAYEPRLLELLGLGDELMDRLPPVLSSTNVVGAVTR